MRAYLLISLLALGATLLVSGNDTCGEHCRKSRVTPAAIERVMAASGSKVSLDVAGVACGGTASQLQALLDRLDGVQASAVEITGEALVAFDDDVLSREALLAAINEGGAFEATAAPGTAWAPGEEASGNAATTEPQ
jgi:copper chaperone CopZ